MRMWLTKPYILCTKHLGGEHVECHMFLGTIKKRKSVRGYLEKGLFEPLKLKERHDQLAEELVRRKKERFRKESLSCSCTKHKSEMILTPDDWEYLRYVDTLPRKKIVELDSLLELMKRCPECRKRILMRRG